MQQDFLLINALFFSLQEDARIKLGSTEANKVCPTFLEERILFCACYSNPPKVIFGREKCTGENVCKILTRLIVNVK